jgi:nucleoside 2-deoxyribosyltransferase
MTTKVYLAGGINGCTDDEAVNWREWVKERLGAENCIDPMRRDYRGREDQCADEIVEGDKADIRESRAVLANCWRVSWGTAMEILFAFERGIPVIAVVPADAVVSPWLRYHTLSVVSTLEEALAVRLP